METGQRGAQRSDLGRASLGAPSFLLAAMVLVGAYQGASALLGGAQVEPWVLLLAAAFGAGALVLLQVRTRFHLVRSDNLAAIIRAVPVGILVVDVEGKIRQSNAESERLFGYGPGELEERPVEVLIPEEERVAHARMRGTFHAETQPRRMAAGREILGRRRDGSVFPAEVGLARIQLGGQVRVLVTVHDVSARREAEQRLLARTGELSRSNAELEQFAYVASHDLQEPLRMVASYTQLLEERYRDQLDEKAQRYIFFAVDGARRMQALINDLLALSRVGSRARPPEEVRSGAAVEEALCNLKLALEEAGAQVEHAELPVIPGDRTELTQLFQNLIGNALKFRGEAPPRVRISAEPGPGAWTFAVADNGMGFEQRFAERIFRPFQRLHERGKFPGTGIGLAIAKKIVEQHGGRIWAEADPGKGATFYFTWPREAPRREALTEAS